VIQAGLGEVKTSFDDRGLRIWRDTEYASPNYYRTVLEDEDNGLVLAEMSASMSRPHRSRNTVNPQPTLWVLMMMLMDRLTGRSYEVHVYARFVLPLSSHCYPGFSTQRDHVGR
jgi:hypothetical protein